MLTRYFCFGLALSLLVYLTLGQLAGGIAAAVLFGFMAGNFACSLIHRLPRKKSMLEHAPYCGECGHPLNEMDLLPVFGVLLLRHKCRYCGVNIPKSHLWTELLIGALFAVCFVQFGFSENFLMVAGIGVFLITLACIEVNDRVVMPSVVLALMVLGMIYRTLLDAEIYNFLQGGLLGLLIGAALWRKEIKPINHIYTLPDGARLLAMAGLCAGQVNFWMMFVLFVAINLVLRAFKPLFGWQRVALSIPVALALMVQFLFPELTLPALVAGLRPH